MFLNEGIFSGAGNVVGMISGISVISNINCLVTSDRPNRKHKKKRWMSDTYHSRIQKKWNKRFGFEMDPAMYRIGNNTIAAYPSMVDQLRQLGNAREHRD